MIQRFYIQRFLCIHDHGLNLCTLIYYFLLQKLQKTAENNGEEDSEDTQRATLELMKRQTQQRIAIIQGQQLNVDDELKQVTVACNWSLDITLNTEMIFMTKVTGYTARMFLTNCQIWLLISFMSSGWFTT